MNIKTFLGQKLINSEYNGKKYEISHKNTAILCGILAQMLLISAAMTVSTNPIYAVEKIIYAFFVLMPISYYNMRNHEKEIGQT